MKLPAAKPQPFNPNVVAPMGSLGDDFDGRIPTEATGTPTAPAHPRARPRSRHVSPKPAKVIEFANTPAALLAIAVIFQTLGHNLRSLLAFVAVLLSVGLLILLNTRFRGARGAWRNYAVLALAVPFLALPEREYLDRPLRLLYFSTISSVINPPSTPTNQNLPNGLTQRRDAWAIEIAEMRQHMVEAGKLAGGIVVECSQEKTLLVGGIPHLSTSPQWAFYEYVPVINFDDDCARSYLERRMGSGALASRVPPQFRDRFSPEGKWPYGTYRKGESMLVWSPGPDGRMDFSPLKEFREDNPALADAMKLKSYDPTNGMLSSGDLMEIVPLPEPELIGF